MALRICSRSLRQLKNSLSAQSGAGKKVALEAFKPAVVTRAFSASVCQLQQSKAYKGLIQTLDREINDEKQFYNKNNELPKVTGFETKLEGAKVALIKSYGDEKISVEFNVNDSLGRYDQNEEDFDNAERQPEKQPDQADFKSRPPFSVTITRENKNLTFNCEFLEGTPDDVEGEENVDDFDIINFAIFDKEMNENVYVADCQYIDSGLYDSLMDILDERGIGQEFAKELANFSSIYESRQYIDLLEKLKSFAK